MLYYVYKLKKGGNEVLNEKKYTLKQLRSLAGFSQEELGELVGVSARTIYDYESDPTRLKNAKHDTLMKILKVLDVDLENLKMEETK